MSNTVLSKRKIEELVLEGHCNGWNDPRLLTLEGLRCRGYTPSMINDFCDHIGVSRKGNENITSIKLLEKFARTELDRLAPRTFGVLDPVLLKIVNLDAAKETVFAAPLFPVDPAQGTQKYVLTDSVFIDAEDFSETNQDKKFFGLSPEQPVCLKYGPVIKLLSVEKNADGTINHAKVEILPDHAEKVKGFLHWVSEKHAMNVTLNLFEVHFIIEDIKKAGDKWLDMVNPNSHVVKNNAKMWNLHKNSKIDDRFQFERLGYFVINEKSDPKKGIYNLNRIVELKESKDKK